ncbi:MAG: hypothetical protein HQL48_00275 [Gammaproteobacteria bacterium]|nr:hypothetical protein [Gammaproteobacteria bacterium]
MVEIATFALRLEAGERPWGNYNPPPSVAKSGVAADRRSGFLGRYNPWMGERAVTEEENQREPLATDDGERGRTFTEHGRQTVFPSDLKRGDRPRERGITSSPESRYSIKNMDRREPSYPYPTPGSYYPGVGQGW